MLTQCKEQIMRILDTMIQKVDDVAPENIDAKYQAFLRIGYKQAIDELRLMLEDMEVLA